MSLSGLWLVLAAAFAPLVLAVPLDQFYPFATPNEASLPTGFSVSSPEVFLSVPIVFFGERYTSLYVNINGLISFLTEVSYFVNVQFPLEYPIIAPLYSNVDTRGSGTVSYRETKDLILLEQVNADIKRLYPNLAHKFNAKSLFIVTWNKVGYFEEGSDKVNTYQVVISSDGEESFVEILYAENGIQWVEGNKTTSLPDARAQAGLVSQDGRMFTLRGSGTDHIKHLDKWSNTGVPGRYIFRVGQISENESVEPPQLVSDGEEEGIQNCETCYIHCHSGADCFDTNSGYCCKCRTGYFGNGRHCYLTDNPVRVSGKVNVNVNGVVANNLDLQAYVLTSDGRIYTAVSGMPKSIGNEMQLVESLSTIIAWMFAKPINDAKNGFQLTGGTLNQSVDITFTSGQKLLLKQKYSGVDVYEQLKMEAEISGNVPVIPPYSSIKVPDFQEQFTRYQPGHFRSQSNHAIEIESTGEQIEYVKDQWLEYTEHCPETYQSISTLRLKSVKNYGKYDVKDNILRFSSTNKISTSAVGEDPCFEGHVKCVANSSCLVQEDSFKCVCNPGFESTSADGNDFGCIDINECKEDLSDCDPNAICENEIGSYMCLCKPGFQGDGRICEEEGYPPEDPCQEKPLSCIPNLYCPNDEEDMTKCVCRNGYKEVAASNVLGFNCEDINECSERICDPLAECYNLEGGYECRCQPGYTGDGHSCQEIRRSCDQMKCPEGSYCEVSASGFPTCICKPGYTGTPPYCVKNIGYGCSSDFECDQAARCVPDSSSGGYSCMCEAGYIGDGYRCIPSGSDNILVKTCRQNICWCPPDYYESGGLCVKNNHSQQKPANQFKKDSCHTLNNCHPDAQCLYQLKENDYQCHCKAGFEGDGYDCTAIEASCHEADICDLNASCGYDETSDRYICICNLGYQGDGTTCYSSDQCSENLDCDVNANCVYNEEREIKECVCKEGLIKVGQSCLDCGKCHEEAECIYDEEMQSPMCKCKSGLVGDGKTECKIQSPGCNILQNCSPHADCLYSTEDQGYRCRCTEGFEGDGLVCNAIRNCYNTPDLCSPYASCLEYHDEYQCRCNEGYIGNGTYCRERKSQGQGFLLINQGRSMLRVPFHPTKFNRGQPIHLHQGQTAIGIAIDCVEEKVYWSDISHQTIKSSNYDGSDIQDILTTGIDSPEGLTVDWVHRNIYWTDSGMDTINMLSLETKKHSVIISDGLVNPRGIAVDPWRRKLFWSDWNREDPKLEFSNLDGSGRAVLLKGPYLKLPNSLAIDWETDELCWADAGTETIECLRVSSNAKRTVVRKCRYPFGLAITTERYYWTDWITHKIETATKDGEISQSIDLPLGGDDKLYGIAAITGTCPR